MDDSMRTFVFLNGQSFYARAWFIESQSTVIHRKVHRIIAKQWIFILKKL